MSYNVIDYSIDNLNAFKDLDDQFLKSYDNTKFDIYTGEAIINRSFAKTYATNHLHEFFPEKTWYRDLKEQSPTLGILMQHNDFIEKNNLTLDLIVRFIVILIHQNPNNILVKLPDLFITKRLNISTYMMYKILRYLKVCKLVIYKRQNGYVNYKLDPDIVLKDEYIYTKFKKDLQYNEIAKDKLLKHVSKVKRYDKKTKKEKEKTYINTRKIKSLYFETKSVKSINRRKREDILGLGLAYSQKLGITGQREDISYIVLPIHIISHITGLSVSKINWFIHNSFKCTEYASILDKHYVNTMITLNSGESKKINHFYNTFYEMCNLQDVKECDKSDYFYTNPYTIIIHEKAFANSNTGKYIRKNLTYYTNRLTEELLYMKANNEFTVIDNSTNNFEFVQTALDNETEELKNLGFYDKDFKESDSSNIGFHFMNLKQLGKEDNALNKSTKLRYNTSERQIKKLKSSSFSELLKQLQYSVKCVSEGLEKDIKHNLDITYDIIEIINYRYKEALKSNNLTLIDKCNKYLQEYNCCSIIKNS